MKADFSGKNVAVLGLGIEGKDAIKYLLSKRAKVTLFDKKTEKDLNFSELNKDDFDLVLGDNYLNGDFGHFDYIVRSPGVYRYLPEIVNAERKGVVVTSAIKIFFENCPAKIIGVTGTKGKGTTSTLIYEILKAGGKDAHLAGNIGKPYLELLGRLTSESWVVMELSSFQLIDLSMSPNIAVVLNITQDHLDWHKNIEEYINAKKNIVSHQMRSDFAVINEEYRTSRDFSKVTKGKAIFFAKKTLETKYKENLLLRGEHNLENIAAAVAVGKIIGVDEKTILQVVRNFKGLEHRLELVAEIDGRTFYNDSFATSPQPTIAAINSFTEPITLILGGRTKGLDYSGLRHEIANKKNIKNLILIGEIGEEIGGGIKSKNIISLGMCPIDQIVKQALDATPVGGVVILSPAATSFDMFKNYKERGLQFKNAVLKLQHG